MEEKLLHGTESFGYAPILTDPETGQQSFGTPVFIPGLTKVSHAADQSNSTIYADNIPYWIMAGNAVNTVTATILQLPNAYLQIALGKFLNQSGMLTDTGTSQRHGIFWESLVETDEGQTRKLFYVYNVLASPPNVELETDSEEITANGLEIEYSAAASTIAFDDNGKPAQTGEIIRTTANASYYDSFRTKILLPGTATEPVGGDE